MGVPPKHPSQRRRRNTPEQWRRLPAEGRKGPAPAWPIGHLRPDSAEAALWKNLWRKPQAIVWAEAGSERLVARYVVHLVQVETRQPETRLLAEVRQLEQLLLLSPGALAKARMEIATDELEPLRIEREKTTAAAKRRRLMAVDGAVAGT